MKSITNDIAKEAWSLSGLLLKLPARQLGLAIWTLIFGGSCVVLSYLYLHAAGIHKAMLEATISELSQAAAIMVDMEAHEALTTPQQLLSPEYRRALAPLVRFHRNLPVVQYVYTMRVTANDELYFVLDTANDSGIAADQQQLGRDIRASMLMEPYTLPYTPAENSELLSTLRAGKTFVDKTPFTDEYGQFVTAHAPLFNSAGGFTGFLGIDYNINAYQQDLAIIKTYGALSLLLAFLVSGLIARVCLQLRQRAVDSLEAMAIARTRAETANRAKSDLLSIASHDLQNPLSAIASMAELLINMKSISNTTPEQEFACLKNIKDSSHHMVALVRRILDNERLESGVLVMEKLRFDLSLMCRAMLLTNEPLAAKKNITLTTSLPTSLMITGDRVHLREAFDNYVNNAIKYSPNGSVIRVWLTTDGTSAEFSVQDEGPGLTEQDMKTVFGKFSKLSARPTGDESSTGLGLSIVKLIIELHGGTVGCSTGKGARFWARLPLQGAT